MDTRSLGAILQHNGRLAEKLCQAAAPARELPDVALVHDHEWVDLQ